MFITPILLNLFNFGLACCTKLFHGAGSNFTSHLKQKGYHIFSARYYITWLQNMHKPLVLNNSHWILQPPSFISLLSLAEGFRFWKLLVTAYGVVCLTFRPFSFWMVILEMLGKEVWCCQNSQFSRCKVGIEPS